MKAKSGQTESESREVMVVDWNAVAAPLDVTVYRNGAKVPRRKVKVRGIVGDAWLEQEAGLPSGSIKRLVGLIAKLARHGYEGRLANSIRFVHMYDKKNGLYLSPQLLQPFKDEVLKGVDFRLDFEGQEVCDLEEARKLNMERISPCAAARRVGYEGCGLEPDSSSKATEITPDVMITCDVCGNHIRVGKKQGK